MPNTAGAYPESGPPGGSAQQPESATRKGPHDLGLTSATGLVIGSNIGTGVFIMPAVLAGAGTSSLIVLAVITLGAMLLAVLFGQLTSTQVRRRAVCVCAA